MKSNLKEKKQRHQNLQRMMARKEMALVRKNQRKKAVKLMQPVAPRTVMTTVVRTEVAIMAKKRL